jgi:hypothetical protein
VPKFADEEQLVRDHLELTHRLNTALAEALFRVAEETQTPPTHLAQMVGMGGGGLHSLFQPLMLRFQEEQQRRWVEAQEKRSPKT